MIIAYCACRARITIAHRRPRLKYLAVMFRQIAHGPRQVVRSSLKSKGLMTLALEGVFCKKPGKIRAQNIFFSLLYCRCDSTTLPSDFPHPSSRRSSGCGILPLPEGWWLKALRAANGLIGVVDPTTIQKPESVRFFIFQTISD